VSDEVEDEAPAAKNGSAENPTPPVVSGASAPANDVEASALVDPEIPRSARVIELFLKLVPEQLSALLEVCQTSDAERIRAASHKLKGGCASVGARAMAELCETIQHDAERGDLSRALEIAQRVQALYASTASILERELAEKRRASA